METMHKYNSALFFSSIIFLAIISFALCLAAEFNKLKRKDILLDGKLCYLPQSDAFGLGMAALVCVSVAQILGTFLNCRKSEQSGGRCQIKKPNVSCILLVFSWISFGGAVILISTTISMSRSQPFGEGWLDGECYLVKDGVYASSAVLAVLALGSTLGSAAIRVKQMQREEIRKVHTKTDG